MEMISYASCLWLMTVAVSEGHNDTFGNWIRLINFRTELIQNELARVISNQNEAANRTKALVQEAFSGSREVRERVAALKDILFETGDYMKDIEKKVAAQIKDNFETLKENIFGIVFKLQAPLKCPLNSQRLGAECLSYSVGARTWHKWRSHCQSLGGDLAALDFEELPLGLLIKALPELQRDLKDVKPGMLATLFVGGSDLTGLNRWQWVTGRQIKMNDTRWFRDQPDMVGVSGERCLAIRFFKVSEELFETGFDDTPCDTPTTAICELPSQLI